MALTVKQVGAGIAHLPPLAPVEVPRNRCIRFAVRHTSAGWRVLGQWP
jgi:hypothetical protein